MALILFLIVTIAIADLEAFEDAQKIAVNKSINHRDELIERCMTVVCAGLLLGGVFSRWEWRTLLWVPAAWGAFTIAFRYLLNRMRSKPWWYVSRSNRYDTLFLNLTGSTFRDNVTAAGQVAYITESVILLASIILYAWAG